MKQRGILQVFFPTGPIITVPAHRVTRHALPPLAHWSGWPKNYLLALARKRLVFGGDWDLITKDCGDVPAFRRVYSLAENTADYRRSFWYLKAIMAFEKWGYFRHKTSYAFSVAEIDTLFEQELLPLVVSMREEGYRQRLGSDVPLAMITRDGEIVKTEKGRHRFAAAQAVGCSAFPLRIAAVHRDWLKTLGMAPFGSSRKRIISEIRKLERQYQIGTEA